MREHSQEAEWLQQRLDQIEADYQRLQDMQAQPPAVVTDPTPPPPPPPTFNAKEHWANAFRRIEQLDPDAADYEDQRLDIMATAQDEANNRIFEAVDMRTEQRIQQETSQALESFRQETQEMIQNQHQANDLERKRAKLLQRATEAGLDVAPPDPENRFGGRHLHDLQVAVDNSLYPSDADEDTAMSAVIKLVADRHGVVPPLADAQPPATPTDNDDIRRTQALNTPMERTGPGRTAPTPPPEEVEPATLDDVVKRTLEPRMVKAN
jgi:hypothetical protein